MNRSPCHHVPALLVLVSALAPAQPQLRVLGVTAGGDLERQACGMARAPVCPGVVATGPWVHAGGTAYDPVRGLAWVSEGHRITAVRVTPTACAIACAPFQLPMIAGELITGLAYQRPAAGGAGALWIVTEVGTLLRAVVDDGCAVTATTMRSLGTGGTGMFAGGLALSERHQTVFLVETDFIPLPFTAPEVRVVSIPRFLQSSSAVVCTLHPATAWVDQVTGAAFDDATSTLLMTDVQGRWLRGQFTPETGATPCTLVIRTECTGAGGDRYLGLEAEPVHAVATGQPCLAAPCQACRGTTLDAVGDPFVGNARFGFSLAGAPAGALAFCFLGFGACTAGVPVLCGAFHLPVVPAPLLIGAAAITGGACIGTAQHALPLPADAALVGAALSIQDLIVCPEATGLGTGLTGGVCLTVLP